MKLIRLVLLGMVATMLAITSAQAAWYAGFHIGPNFPSLSNAEATSSYGNFSFGNLSSNTGLMIGGQLGFDFLSDTQQFPAWTEFLTLAVDFTVNTISIPDKSTTFQRGNIIYNAFLNSTYGAQYAFNFLAIGKIPLVKGEKFPKGRLFPYGGVGPSLVLTNFSNTSSFDVGVVVEAGVRFMFTPHLSGDLAYRFYYVAPSNIEPSGLIDKVSWSQYNNAILFRINTHF
jgi:opacity protein-like surface antigen